MTARKTRPEASPEAVLRATGKTAEDWFAILDAAGARDMSHKDIAVLLNTQHGVSPWWSQHVTVEYERARGMRERYQTTRGYQVSVTKTLPVPLSQLSIRRVCRRGEPGPVAAGSADNRSQGHA